MGSYESIHILPYGICRPVILAINEITDSYGSARAIVSLVYRSELAGRVIRDTYNRDFLDESCTHAQHK